MADTAVDTTTTTTTEVTAKVSYLLNYIFEKSGFVSILQLRKGKNIVFLWILSEKMIEYSRYNSNISIIFSVYSCFARSRVWINVVNG